MPRSESNSSTSRYESPYRRHHRTRHQDHLRREPEPRQAGPRRWHTGRATTHQPSLPEQVIRQRNGATRTAPVHARALTSSGITPSYGGAEPDASHRDRTPTASRSAGSRCVASHLCRISSGDLDAVPVDSCSIECAPESGTESGHPSSVGARTRWNLPPPARGVPGVDAWVTQLT